MSPATVGRPGSLPDQDSTRELVGNDPQDRAPGQEGALTRVHILCHPSKQHGDLTFAGPFCSDRHPKQESDPLLHIHHRHHPGCLGLSRPTPRPNLTRPYAPPHHFVSATHEMRRSQGPIRCPRMWLISETRETSRMLRGRIAAPSIGLIRHRASGRRAHRNTSNRTPVPPSRVLSHS